MKTVHQHDVIILGGGIAGMTAAIYTARANLTTVIIDKMVCGGLVNSTYVVENFPSHISIHGMDLMEKVQEQVLNLSVEIEQMAEIISLDITGDIKQVEAEDAVYQGPSIILATGREPVKLDIDTDCEEIHYCSVCDGSHYKGKKVLVVGGGNSGFDESLYLLSLGVEKLTLIEIADHFFAAPSCQDRLLENDKVDAHTSTRIGQILTDANGRLNGVILENTDSAKFERLDVDGIFVYMGQKPSTDMFRGIVKLDDAGYIFADQRMATNVSGVFAAGDVVRKEYRQITTAMSDGTIAALEAARYLRDRPECSLVENKGH